MLDAMKTNKKLMISQAILWSTVVFAVVFLAARLVLAQTTDTGTTAEDIDVPLIRDLFQGGNAIAGIGGIVALLVRLARGLGLFGLLGKNAARIASVVSGSLSGFGLALVAGGAWLPALVDAVASSLVGLGIVEGGFRARQQPEKPDRP